jgi:hypothetical protein
MHGAVFHLSGSLVFILKLCTCFTQLKSDVTIKLFVCLTKHHIRKTIGVDVQRHAFLTSTLERGECQLHDPTALPRRKSHWTGGWVGPRASVDAVEKRKIPSTTGNQTPRSQSLYRLSYPGLCNDKKDRFYEELKRVFDHMKNIVGECGKKLKLIYT